MAVSLADFRAFCTGRGLLLETELDDVVASLSSPDVKQLATVLVQRHRLTTYQASEIYQGRGDRLLLGDYLLLDKLGAGGMGEVFKAQHRRMKRFVALKVLPSAVSKNADSLRRFQREVEAAAKLSHPHIVQSYDAGEHRGTHYLVMEYVDGSDLASLVKRHGPLGLDHALHCLIQASLGLAYAHDEGVIHRDIKPANLLLDKKGVVKVLDLGLARIDDPTGVGDAALTTSGAVMGTVDFMSPEQALDTKHADARSDVYSLGCTLFYLLTGEKVYEGDTVMKKLLAHREAPIPSLRALRIDVPEAVDKLFQRLVAKQPADRPQTMHEVHKALTASLPGAEGGLDATAQLSIQSMSDSDLVSFLKKLPAAGAAQFSAQEAGRAVTLSPHDGSDTHKKKSVSGRSEKPMSAGAVSRSSKRTVALVAGGIVACAALILGTIAWKFGAGEPQNDAPIARTPGAAGVSRPVAARPTSPAQRKPPAAAEAPFDAAKAKQLQQAWAEYAGVPVTTTNSLGMQFVVIPPGSFVMGATEEEILKIHRRAKDKSIIDSQAALRAEQRPKHRVTLTRPFLMAAHETTVGEFRKFVEDTGYKTAAEASGRGAAGWSATEKNFRVVDARYHWQNVGYATSDLFPVGAVTWEDAVQFCNWLSKRENLAPCYVTLTTGETVFVDGPGYRLPTEAEWEYACRAGTTTLRYWGDDQDVQQLTKHAVYDVRYQTYPVGERLANPFGLYDILGNVGEFCNDWHSADYYETLSDGVVDPPGPTTGSSRIVRGINASDESITAAHRIFNSGSPMYHLGFRVVRTLSPQAEVPPQPPASAVAPFDAAKASALQRQWAAFLRVQVTTTDKNGLEMQLIPPGEFTMGASEAEIAEAVELSQQKRPDAAELKQLVRSQPQRRVRITAPFLMGRQEVSVAQFRRFVDAAAYKTDLERSDQPRQGYDGSHVVFGLDFTWRNPGYDQREDHPVVLVTWNDAVEFCNWCSREQGLQPYYVADMNRNWVAMPTSDGYRLPTEAQWEYTCRAGTTAKWQSGDDDRQVKSISRIGNNAGPTDVEAGLPNRFGLYNHMGNVSEWCSDWFAEPYAPSGDVADPSGPTQGTERCVRGGSWYSQAAPALSAYRGKYPPTDGYVMRGFRIVRSLTPPPE